MKRERSFASDNNSGVHPLILQAMSEVNKGHEVGYGDDPYTKKAVDTFKKYFGEDIDVYFVYGGTGANVTALKAVTDSYHSIICAKTSHINTDECGAPEKFTGCKLVDIDTPDGKLTPDLVENVMHGRGDEHQSQPKVISITQATELGTVYTQKEIKAISDFAHKNDLLVQMDGARIANAAAYLGVDFRDITTDAGVDILSFGGTKNGMMYGEAVIFFNKELSRNYKYFRKQGMQLASKMRYISAQFSALFSDNLWLKNAEHSNKMAKLLEQKLKDIEGVDVMFPVEANAIFARVDKEIIASLKKEFYFYVVDETVPLVRWMCSFDTQQKDIEDFTNLIKELINIS